MLRKLRRRISFANVTSLLALFVALGGTSAYAINEWNSSNIQNETLLSEDIKNGEIGSADVKDNSINTFDANALHGSDIIDGSLTGADITNSSLSGADVFDNSIGSADVTNNSLTGTDINEASLGTVTSSVLGGVGRRSEHQSGSSGACNPEPSDGFVNCDTVAQLDLPRPARVLVIGSFHASTESGEDIGLGDCQVATTGPPGFVPDTFRAVTVENQPGGFPNGSEEMSIAGVTEVLPAGQHTFGLECREHTLDPDPGGIDFLGVQLTAVALSDQ